MPIAPKPACHSAGSGAHGGVQAGDGFVFHLDAPTELVGGESVELMGWIAGHQEMGTVCVVGTSDRELACVPRPDVQAAFPGYPCVVGFRGQGTSADFRADALHFRFRFGTDTRDVSIPLPRPPAGLRGWRRVRAQADAAIARWRLRRPLDPARQWNARLRLLLADIQLRRGDSFRRAETDQVLELFAQIFPRAKVVQIGANDGWSGDPLVRWFGLTQWSGLLVEPVPRLAAQLAERYADRPDLLVEPTAIAETDGRVRLYRIADQPGDPAWYQQLATLDREVLLKHRGAIPQLDSRIVEESVASATVKTLLERHAFDRIDLLVIDTEGADFRILRQFDLAKTSPIVLLFEHQHLTADDKRAAYALIARHGYRHAETPEGDCIAWRFI